MQEDATRRFDPHPGEPFRLGDRQTTASVSRCFIAPRSATLSNP